MLVLAFGASAGAWRRRWRRRPSRPIRLVTAGESQTDRGPRFHRQRLNYDTQISSQMCHTQTDNRANVDGNTWGGNKWKQTFYVCHKSAVKASRCNLERPVKQAQKQMSSKKESCSHSHIKTHTSRSDVRWLQRYPTSLHGRGFARPDFSHECSRQQKLIVGNVSPVLT